MQLKGQEHITYRGTMIQIMPSFLLGTMETKHKRTYISMEEKQKQKIYQNSIIYPVKISLENKSKIRLFEINRNWENLLPASLH